MKNILYISLLISSMTLLGCLGDQAVPKVPSTNTGVGGSLARFSVVGDFLYVIDNTDLKMYNVTQAENPRFIKSVNVGRGIETIFPFGGKLFIGSQNGLFIYDILSDGTPHFISEYVHMTSCDPVATDGNFAYVTLRSVNECGFQNAVDELHILDVTDIENPQVQNIIQMEGPLGVGVKNNVLFVCDGDAGLKIFNATNAPDLTPITTLENIPARDVIVLDTTALVLTSDKIYQVDYSDLNNIQIISSMRIEV